jgi:DNA-binding SARP family transcriptional activator
MPTRVDSVDMSPLANLVRPSNVGVPELGGGVVHRPRAVAELLDALEGARVVHVVAPAGAGKTTLVAQAVYEAGIPAGWVTLEHWDRSPGRLVADLIVAIAGAVPAARAVLKRADNEDSRELARAVATLVGAREVVLVIDNADLLAEWTSAAAVVGELLHVRRSGLKLVLVSRRRPVLAAVGADVVAATRYVGDDTLRADLPEARSILEARGWMVDPEMALEASGGWIAGLVLEPGRGAGLVTGRLAEYLSAEVRPRLTLEQDRFLVRCSIFDRIDRPRATALGQEGQTTLDVVRGAGLPGVWDERAGEFRMHPLIRELLRDALDAGPVAERRSALASAAAAYEREGEPEHALEAWISAGELSQAGRLLPGVIMDVVARLDVELAERLLEAVPLEPEPPQVMYARLCLANLAQAVAPILPLLGSLERTGSLERVAKELPAVGTLVVAMLSAMGRVDDAVATLELIPPGRARDTARLVLSDDRDDPDAPIPPFEGDMLDSLIARGLYSRGRIAELHRLASPTLAQVSGVPDLAARAGDRRGPLADCLARLHDAVSSRDLDSARDVVGSLEAFPGTNIYTGLARAEIAIRIERSGESAMRGLELACALPEAENVSLEETINVWRGAALLLLDEPEKAVPILRQAAASMRRGGRLLMLPTALVYLAEAKWRTGLEEEADAVTREAHDIAVANGDLGRLILALADFPGVLSRALDLEAGLDGTWHALGRAIVARPSSNPSLGTASVHLREFGEPVVLIDGILVRPKIRKSLELLSFLVSRPAATARRSEILTALWNGRDDDATRAYLRQAVKHVREALPDGASLETSGGSLSLSGAFTSEMAELDARLRAADASEGATRRSLLLKAIEIGRRGHFLEGSRNVAWVDERRACVEAWLIKARLDAATTLIDETRFLEALALIDDALEFDQLVERAWRLRMRALGMLGDLDGVLDAFRGCSAALGTLGLTPSRGTLEVARRLRAA